MKPDHTELAEERFRTQINLAHSYLDIIELCLNDHSDLAHAVESMLVDSLVILAEEMQESVDDSGYE